MAMFSSKLSCLLCVLSVATTHALNVPFERRAYRGASITSPFRAAKYSFGQTNSDEQSLGNVGDFRVRVFTFGILHQSLSSGVISIVFLLSMSRTSPSTVLVSPLFRSLDFGSSC
jgi:hypothetical protein